MAASSGRVPGSVRPGCSPCRSRESSLPRGRGRAGTALEGMRRRSRPVWLCMPLPRFARGGRRGRMYLSRLCGCWRVGARGCMTARSIVSGFGNVPMLAAYVPILVVGYEGPDHPLRF